MSAERHRALPRLGWQLTLQILGIVLLLMAILVPLFYYLHERPLIVALAEAAQTRAIERIQDRLTAQFRPIERSVRQSQNWGSSGLYSETNVDGFNRLMMPLLRSAPFISSVVVANQRGEEILLIKGGQEWTNRITRADEWGHRQQWLHARDGEPLQTEWKEGDYDPRKRPWYAGALQTEASGDIHWSSPYVLISTGEVAISASASWHSVGEELSHVVDFDMTLVDVTKVTQNLVVGKSGYIALLDSEDHLVGLPREPVFTNSAAIRKGLLKRPDELGLHTLTTALKTWHQSADKSAIFRFDGDLQQAWIGSVKPVKIGQQTLYAVALAPESDFFTVSERLLLSSVAALLVVILLSYLLAQRIVTRVRLPLEQLARESERIGAMQLDEPVQVNSRFREILHLTHAQERMRLLLLDAKLTLEDANRGLEEKITLRTLELEAANQEMTNVLQRLRDTQTQLIQSEKLSALGKLVAGVSHELNTPIGNCLLIASTVEIQQNQFEEHLNQGLRRSVLNGFLDKLRDGNQILMRNLKRAAELVQSFKQIAVDQGSDQRREFDLEQLVHEIQISLSPSLQAAACVFRNEVPLGMKMDSYPGAMLQIISNLSMNAVTHGFEGMVGGEIIVSATGDVPGAGDSQLRLSFQDNGHGIPAENLPRIFDPFFTTKLGQGGSGLGLNIVYNLVTRVLGGEIAVHSEQGCGTRFVLTLPRRAPARVPVDAEVSGIV